MTETTECHDRDLKKETLFYGAAMVMSGLVQLAFLPFISSRLTASQTGELGALRIISEAIAGIVVLGLPTALIRFWHRTDAHRDILKRAMLLPLVSTIIVAALLFLLGGWLSSVLRLEHPEYLFHSLALGVAVAYVQISLCLPRAEGMAGKYLMFQILRGVASLGLLVFLIYFISGIASIPAFLSARWIPSILVVGAAFIMMWRKTAPAIHKAVPERLTGRILAFSLPLVPASLAMIVLSTADVFMLRNIYPDLSASGYYEWAGRVCLALTPLTIGFGMAWQRYIFRKKKEGGHMAELGRSALLFMVLVNWAAMILAMAAPEITALVGGPAYLGSARVLPTLAGASALYALFMVSQTGPLLTGQTKFIAGMTIFGAMINIIFNYRLIPVAGALGAAFATLCTNLFMALSLFWLGRKVFPISFIAVALVVFFPVLYGPLANLAPLWRSGFVVAASLFAVLIIAGLRRAGASLKSFNGS